MATEVNLPYCRPIGWSTRQDTTARFSGFLLEK